MRKGKRVKKKDKLDLIRDLAMNNEFNHYISFLKAFRKASTIFNIDGYTIGESTFKKDLKAAGITQDKDQIFRVSDENIQQNKLDNFWKSFYNLTDMDSNVDYTELFIKTLEGCSEYLAHEFKNMYGEKILGYSALKDCLILYVPTDFAEEFNKNLLRRYKLEFPSQE